jgi:transcriptional regulator with XRE-family HTH domain
VATKRAVPVQRLRVLRALASLTQDDIARACGMAQSKVNRIERGRLLPRSDEVTALARAYGTTVADLRACLGLSE